MLRPSKISLGAFAERRSELMSVGAVDRLFGDVRALMELAGEHTARAVISALVDIYRKIRTRIRQEILREKRAGYGEQIVSAQLTQLTAELGPGYTENGLRRMIQFVGRFADEEIVAALSRESSWSQFVELILDIRVRVVTDLCVPGVGVAPLP